jgi:uncharacterized protein (TIGR02246 family)
MNFAARFVGTRFVLLFASFLACIVAINAGQNVDEAAIRELQTRQQEAWNHRDAKAYANLFTEDGDVVNVLGWWWKGRSEIESKLTRAYAFIFKDSTLTITDVQIKFLTSEIAVARVPWTMVGANSADGNPMHIPQRGIQLQTLRKQGGAWLIAAFQNTNSVPEVPFPAGPASPTAADGMSTVPSQEPTAAEMSKKETVASAFVRFIGFQEYQVRSAAEAMPKDKYGYRPAEGKFKNEKPEYGPAEVRTFAEQVKHVACSNFGFAAELDGFKPPEACDKGGPSPAKSKTELLTYLRDSFAAIRKSLGAIDAKNMFEPIEGPYAGPNTRLGLAIVIVWHAADHGGQMTLYLRDNNIVPPASRTAPPPLQDKY